MSVRLQPSGFAMAPLLRKLVLPPHAEPGLEAWEATIPTPSLISLAPLRLVERSAVLLLLLRERCAQTRKEQAAPTKVA
jgi:hypothetical protein